MKNLKYLWYCFLLIQNERKTARKINRLGRPNGTIEEYKKLVFILTERERIRVHLQDKIDNLLVLKKTNSPQPENKINESIRCFLFGGVIVAFVLGLEIIFKH